MYTESKYRNYFTCKAVCVIRISAKRGQYRLPSPALDRAITNDWRISMARSIVGNRANSGSDQRLMYDQLLRPTTERSINRCILRPIVRSIVTSCDRSVDQS